MQGTTSWATVAACISTVIIAGIIGAPSCERAENDVKIACINAGGTWDGRTRSCTDVPARTAP